MTETLTGIECPECGGTPQPETKWIGKCDGCGAAVHLYHWFASTAYGWSVAEADELASIARSVPRVPSTVGFILWRVPGPSSREYTIDHYAPQVEGTECFGFQRFKRKTRKAA